MTWKAWLTGHEFDLRELSQLFSTGDTQVIKGDDESFYLVSMEVDNRPEAEQFHEAAARVLTLVNGVGQANNSSFRPVTLSGRYQEGDQPHQVVLAGTAEVRLEAYAAMVVTGSDGAAIPPPPPPGPDRVRKALSHSDAAEALRIMSKSEPTSWVDLFKVYEIIRGAMGSETGVIRSGLATRSDISAFTVSANLPSVSGEGARHARLAGTPRRTMTIATARDFIGRLLTTWLDSLQ